MAEVLVKVAKTGTGPYAYEPNDAVVIMEDDHPWGRQELNKDKFYILSLPGPASKYQFLLEERKSIVIDPRTGEETILGRRQRRIEKSTKEYTDKDSLVRKSL